MSLSVVRVAVTGAFGYSGRYIARRLLASGYQVITLTNSTTRPNPFGGQVPAFPFNFDRPDALVESLNGTKTLINTYWVRFDHRRFTHAEAVRNTKTLFRAAKAAGVKRVVHVSITNPDASSDLPYFRGKAELESDLQNLGVSYGILRPTVLFGNEDILINNIAWALRHFPVFGVFGSGDYRLQPIFVEDLAQAAVDVAGQTSNQILNAPGPETLSYRELVDMIRRHLGVRCPVISVPPAFGYRACQLLGLLMKDVVITREEIRGLMQERLYVAAQPLGRTRLSDWLREHRDTLGRRYANELARRVEPTKVGSRQIID